MDESDFKQNMSSERAKSHAVKPENIPEEAKAFIATHYSKLPERPDYDGYLTLQEANEWYRNGNGEPLYIDLKKLDLSCFVSLGDEYIGKEYTFNLSIWSNNINEKLVFGNVKFIRCPNDGVRAYADTYDFDMKSGLNPLIIIRNIQTIIGSIVAGKGVPYNIYFYGTAKLRRKGK